MKIAIISQSPLLTTGFGITASKIISSLLSQGHQITCFSMGHDDSLDAAKEKPLNIWLSGWPNVVQNLSCFLHEENPDAILINFDIKTTAYFVYLCRQEFKWIKRILAHVVIDGFPVNTDTIEKIKSCDGLIVPTKKSMRYLKSQGISNVYYAPHGVDQHEFIHIKDKNELRHRFGLSKELQKSFIIGVFAKNEERKQIPKILLALQQIMFSYGQTDIYIYLHTQLQPMSERGSDLAFIIDHLKIGDNVLLPNENFRQDNGTKKIANSRSDLNYVELINMCDLIVNIPFSGGFELCNIEAQSCGIPLLTINDKGNIYEVVGKTAMLIKPKLSSFWGNGALIHYVDEGELTECILKIKNNNDVLEYFKLTGLQNAKKYSWQMLEQSVLDLIQIK